MKFGEIKMGGKFGGFSMLAKPSADIPPEVVKGVNTVFGENCVPVWYFGNQVVNGMNHLVLCKKEQDSKKTLILVTINIPFNNDGGLATAVNWVEEADLYGSLGDLFENAMKDITGVNYKPIAFMGEKLVKGKNYYILCQATIAESEPYAVIVEINEFMGKATLIGIERLGGLGYAFTW